MKDGKMTTETLETKAEECRHKDNNIELPYSFWRTYCEHCDCYGNITNPNEILPYPKG
jgi:hypothetical protein